MLHLGVTQRLFLCQILDGVFGGNKPLPQALAREIKAAGSIQRQPGFLAAKRWQLRAGGKIEASA